MIIISLMMLAGADQGILASQADRYAVKARKAIVPPGCPFRVTGQPGTRETFSENNHHHPRLLDAKTGHIAFLDENIHPVEALQLVGMGSDKWYKNVILFM